MYLVPVAAVLALLFAAYLAAKVSKQDAGTDRMKEIAGAIAEGARAFLTAEYKILVIFVAVLFVLIGIGVGSWVTAICFVVGALFSTIAGYCGMTVATKANVRTANAAKEGGMNKALSIAFSGGAVMGMCVAGLGALGVSVVYIITKNVDVLSGFSLGASSIALFARVGGGIYTKAADVGADLVGKVEAGIPEDDPRNPAVIADNVGDNVGDVAGMGADLFESYVGSLVSALTLGAVAGAVSGVLYPLAIAGCGLIASIIATFFVKGDKNLDSVIKEIEKLDINWREYNLIKSSSNYPALQQSISGIYSISNKLFAGSLIFAGVVVSLLLLLWMNARKKEIAVLLSLGISKLEIFGQFLIEMVFISIPAYVGSYFLARYTAEKLGNNILNKVTGDIAKQIARQSASSQLGGGAEAEGFNKTLSSLDINVLPKFIFYVVIFMSLVLLVSLIISSFNILRRNPKELLIDNK